jgi:putative peptidoglycan lipid II flippase
VLNSHRRFFLSYFAPVLWNVAIIGGLVGAGYMFVGEPWSERAVAALTDATRVRLLFAICWAALAGGLLQFAVQLPVVLRVMRGFRLALSLEVEGVRQALRATGPALAGRGAYQLSAYLDLFLASWLAAGAPSSLQFAQVLYLLPVSLFGMSVAASELPELARIGPGAGPDFHRRLDASLRQMSFLTLPTLVGYLAFGFLVVGAIYRRGAFGATDHWLVYLILAAYSLGLLATTMSRLLQSSFYAVGETRTPAKVAGLRVAASTLVAVPAMLFLDRYSVAGTLGLGAPGRTLYLGALGLALGSAVGGWTELVLLQLALRRRLAAPGLPWAAIARFCALAVAAALPAALLWWLLPPWPLVVVAALVVGLYAAAYLTAAHLLELEEMEAWGGRLLRRLRRSRRLDG